MSDQTAAAHRRSAPRRVRCVVITVSDSRTAATDLGGATVVELLSAAGHEVIAKEIVADEPAEIRQQITRWQSAVDVILLTGGTGIGRRDQTYETVTDLLTRSLPGYGELFRALSFQQIGPAAMLSRATGGLVGTTVLLTMPGSPAAVRLALEQIILPEIGHLVAEATK
jgi:molybdenum cofactor biosynthesis protein B